MFQRYFSENTPFLLVAIALLSLTANIVLADSVESRELWPCSDGQLGDIDWRSRVLDVLLPDAVSDTSFRCVVIPAFEPEWILLGDCKRNGQAILEYRVAEENIWDANWVAIPTEEHPDAQGWSDTPVPIRTERREVHLSDDTCEILQNLWSKVLESRTG